MERPRSIPRYSASRFAGIAAPLQDGSGAASSSGAERAGPWSTTSAAKRTRFMLPRRAFSRFRFSEEERQGRSRAGDGDVAAASEETRWWSVCLARQSEKRTRVPESAMAVAARARPAWEPPSAEPAPAEDEDDDDMAQCGADHRLPWEAAVGRRRAEARRRRLSWLEVVES